MTSRLSFLLLGLLSGFATAEPLHESAKEEVQQPALRLFNSRTEEDRALADAEGNKRRKKKGGEEDEEDFAYSPLLSCYGTPIRSADAGPPKCPTGEQRS
jgi:hypothetical protein